MTSIRSSGLPHLGGLSGPTNFRLNRMDLPCSRQRLWLHAGGTNPGSISGRSLQRGLRFRLPLYGIGSATPITIDFNLPVYSSQRPLPDATQDSVRGCSLGCAAAVIADGRLQRACKAQSAQIRPCATNALGSYFEYLTWDRWFGHGCSTLGDGKNRLISRIVRSHVSRRRWLRRRKLRNQIMLV